MMYLSDFILESELLSTGNLKKKKKMKEKKEQKGEKKEQKGEKKEKSEVMIDNLNYHHRELEYYSRRTERPYVYIYKVDR